MRWVARIVWVCVLVLGISQLCYSADPTSDASGQPTNEDYVAPSIDPARYALPAKLSRDGLNPMVSINVGTPEQTMTVILDTGSTNFMLFDRTLCSGSLQHAGAPGDCYSPNASTSSDDLGPLDRSTGIRVDGHDVIVRRTRVYSDTLEASAGRIGQFGATVSRSVNSNILVINQNSGFEIVRQGDPPPVHTFNFTDGILGVAYNSLTGYSILNLFSNSGSPTATPTFALDISNDGTVGSLDLGGIQERYRADLSWSPRLGAIGTTPTFHAFSMHDLTLCGASLTKFGNPFSAIVDTGASCLGVPSELFDMIFSWIPAECTADGNTCNLPANVQPSLPTLDFRMYEGGPLVHLPLQDLLLPPRSDEQGRQRYCIYRGASLEDDSASSLSKKVSFGTRTLFSLYAAFNMPTRQVGLANKRFKGGSLAQCRVTKECVGMQTRDATLNVCVDPKCSDYYFFTLVSTTHTCHLSAAFHTLAAIFITGVLATELYLYNQYQRITDKVHRLVRPS